MAVAPYPTVQQCMNVASVRVNDAMKQVGTAPAGQIGGEITGAQQIFSQTVVNAAWQRFQEFLVSQNFSRLINTVTLPSVTAVGTSDPGVNCYIDWTGYFDGFALQASPVLPQDLSTPLRLKERVHGATGVSAEFTPMEYVVNGLTGLVKGPRNFNWAWDDDKLLFPGSTQVMDMELRYASFLPDFVDGAVSWYLQPVPIMRSQDAFAWYIAFEYSAARGDMDSAAIGAMAEAAALKLVQRELQNDQLRAEWIIPDIPNATGATHYDTLNTVLNTVKTRLNSLTSAPNKDVVITNQPYMQQCANTAWRKMQMYLADKGYIRFTDEIILTNLGPKVSQDPAVQPFIDWTGYNNGTTLDTAIAFPENLILPMKLWQRVTGQNAMFSDICLWIDGMPSMVAMPYTQTAEWRGDALYFSGFNQPIDLRVRYAKYIGDFIEANGLPWYMQPVPIVRALDSLSLYICAEIAGSRPDLELDTAAFTQGAEAAANLIYNRDVRQKQRVNVRRLSRSGRLEGTQGGWGQNYGSWN
jgi:hypothetical protein